jgi:thiamine-phosphate pyrophosphorylase
MNSVCHSIFNFTAAKDEARAFLRWLMDEKQLGTRAMIEQARALLEVLRPRNIPLIVNDRVDVALAIDADGVHVGREDMPPDMARQLLGPDKIVGASVHTEAHIAALDPAEVDYFGAGAAFATSTKTNTAGLLGLEGLTRLRRATRLPMVAIAGIGIDTAASVMATGVDGIAVVSAICAAEDCRAAATRLRAIIADVRGASVGAGPSIG